MTFEHACELHLHGQLDEAKAILQQLIQQTPGHVEALHRLAVIYAEDNCFIEAENCLRKAMFLARDDLRLPLHLANVLKAQARFQEAITVLMDVLSRDAGFAAAYNNLGTNYAALGDWSNAALAYQQAIDCQADYVDAYYNLGLAQLKLNQWEKAAATFDAVLAFSPQHAGGLFQTACLHMRQQQFAKAKKIFMQMHEAYPHHGETITNLATCHLKCGELSEAKHAYRKALALHPEDTQILYNLGVISTQCGTLTDAVHYYQQALRINPNLYEAHYNLGTLYHYMKNQQDALHHLRNALRIQPNNAALQYFIQVVCGDTKCINPPDDYIHDLFDAYADHYDQHVRDALDYRVPHIIVSTLTQHDLKPRHAWRTLDLGCGTGLCGEALEPFARELVGVDLSPNMLAFAKQKNIYAALHEMSIPCYLATIKQSSFDLIAAADVFVYFADLKPVIQAVWQALSAGGYFIFNIEHHSGKPSVLPQHGRFAHTSAYMAAILQCMPWKVISQQVIPLRTQDRHPVAGMLYLCQKSEGSSANIAQVSAPT